MDNEKELLYESKGIDIFDHINQLAIDEASARRWVWELLQNAVDIAVSEQGVSTEFILTELSAIFKHNGFPFDEVSLNHLFFKKSQKREKKEGEITIGNFGTGFLTTHLLSKKVEISGVYKKRSGTFTKLASVCLDRSGDEKNITKALKQYSFDRDVIENNTDTEYNPNSVENTVFSYIFTENTSGLHTGKRGIEDLKNALSFAILFISQIKKLKSVRVKNELDNTDEIYVLNENAKRTIGELEIQKIEHNNKATYIAIISDRITSIAMQVDFINDNEIKLIAKNKQTPNLFKVFPFVGSENFAFPTIINSLKFEPTKEREGIILSGSEQLQTQIATNRQIMLNVVAFYQNFIKIICTDKTYKWTCLYELANIDTPENSKHLVDLEWYKTNVILPIRKTLLEMSIVEIKVDENKTDFIILENAVFPYTPYGREEDLLPFWDICFEFLGSKIPKRENILSWNKILNYEEWARVKENINLKYDLKRLLKDIEQIGSVAKLAESHFASNEIKSIEWLNKVIAFVFKQDETKLFETIKVIPNQLGEFKLIEKLVSDKDTRIPDELKIILKELSNDDWREKLVHKDIVCELPVTQKTGVIQISTTIDTIIEENKNANIRKAVYHLISFYSPEFADNENNETWRKSVYQLAKDLDNSVPELQTLTGLIPNLWKKADEWIFENLVKDIANQKNIENLRTKLNKEMQIETISWLNNFIGFYETKQKARFYSDKAIFPNQEGDFREKSKLHFDKINYKELKNVLKEFGHNWYQILLDEGITNIKGFEQENPLTIKSISNAIYEQIKDKDLNQSEKFRNAIYELVSFLPNNDFSERKRLLSFANAVYPDRIRTVENAIILPKLSTDFDFSLVNEWILKALVTELNDVKSLDKLQELNAHFKNKTEVETIKWLDDFISFVAGFENHKYKSLLENFAIIPNQNNNFKSLKSLQRDLNIPKDLKDIANANYIRHDWNDDLLHKQLPQTVNLFDEKSSSSIQDIASEIDNAVRDSEGTDKENKNFVELINLLLQSETVNSNEKLFQYFHSHKSILVLATLGEGKVRSDIFDILQNRQKLDVLAKLAKSDVSMEQLETFNNAIELVGAENINILVNKAKEEKEQENFHTRLGTLAEQIFKNELENQGFEVERTGLGSDFKLKKGSFIGLIEIKSFVEGVENSVKMTSYQAQTAIVSENYILCVFPKTSALPTETDFKTKVKFVVNIAENLRNVIDNATQLEQQRENAINQQIGLVFEKWEYKYKISKSVWEVGKNLADFIDYLTTK